MAEARTNWAGNLTYQAKAVHQPTSLEQVQELVARSRRLKVVGTRHSFNGIADTTADHISLEEMNHVVALDRAAGTVTIEGGMRYGELGSFLHREGFALPNLASLPHISVAGAVATATHGSGDELGNLATAVAAVELVTDDGTVMTFSRRENSPDFAGVVVGLGALGIVTKMTLKVEPTYDVAQLVLENLPLAQVEKHFETITADATSVSLFTDWQADRFHQWWLKQRTDRETGFFGGKLETATTGAPADERDQPQTHEPVNRVFPSGQQEHLMETLKSRFHGATLARASVHPLPGHDAENCTLQLGIPGPWHERLPHFRLEFTPSSGAELQSEYFVPRWHAVPALRALFALRADIAPHIFVSEVRTIAADELWLSPCYRQACVAVHFTWKPDWPAVERVLPRIEQALAPFDARPHWGKLFTMPPAVVRSFYPKWHEFLQLCGRLDPGGKFRNAYLEALLNAE